MLWLAADALAEAANSYDPRPFHACYGWPGCSHLADALAEAASSILSRSRAMAGPCSRLAEAATTLDDRPQGQRGAGEHGSCSYPPVQLCESLRVGESGFAQGSNNEIILDTFASHYGRSGRAPPAIAAFFMTGAQARL